MAETPAKVALTSLASRGVGCQHRPEVTQMVCAAEEGQWMDKLSIEFEPENKYDANAIKISFDGELLAYIPKDAQIPARRYLLKVEELRKQYSELHFEWDIVHVQWESNKDGIFKWFEFVVSVYGPER
jgi:hypothetical protein